MAVGCTIVSSVFGPEARVDGVCAGGCSSRLMNPEPKILPPVFKKDWINSRNMFVVSYQSNAASLVTVTKLEVINIFGG